MNESGKKSEQTLTFGLHYGNRGFASVAAKQWLGDADSIEHISDSGNSVYRFRRSGLPLILRLTDPGYRSAAENLAELRFIRHLAESGVQVATPVLSANNNWIEEAWCGEGMLLASVFTVAPGQRVGPDSPHWGAEFFRDWGRAMGAIHHAATTFPATEAEGRWRWHDEVFLQEAERLIPADDTESLRELEAVLHRLNTLPTTPDLFGMTHADFGPQNFHFSIPHGITAFDFGNCCRHWFISDVAIAATLFRNHPSRKEVRDTLVAGYREAFPIAEEMLQEFGWFIRLRALYVYLSRLMKFGPNPNPQEEEILHNFRAWVHQRDGW